MSRRCVTAIWPDAIHGCVEVCRSKLAEGDVREPYSDHQRNASAADRRDKRQGDRRTLTSGYNPNSTPRDGERVRLPIRCGSHLDHDLALVHEEAHLHLAAILRTLEAFWRQFDDARAEEGQGHDFGVLEFRPCHVAGDDAGLGEGEVCGCTS